MPQRKSAMPQKKRAMPQKKRAVPQKQSAIPQKQSAIPQRMFPSFPSESQRYLTLSGADDQASRPVIRRDQVHGPRLPARLPAGGKRASPSLQPAFSGRRPARLSTRALGRRQSHRRARSSLHPSSFCLHPSDFKATSASPAAADRRGSARTLSTPRHTRRTQSAGTGLRRPRPSGR
jgi:hypothetical protein